MLPELLPCPFCGGAGELINDPDDSGPRVICIGTLESGCETEGPRTYWGDCEDDSYAVEEAVRLWNTRDASRIETREGGNEVPSRSDESLTAEGGDALP